MLTLKENYLEWVTLVSWSVYIPNSYLIGDFYQVYTPILSGIPAVVVLPGLCLLHHGAGVAEGNFSVLRTGKHDGNLLSPRLAFKRLKHADGPGA